MISGKSNQFIEEFFIVAEKTTRLVDVSCGRV